MQRLYKPGNWGQVFAWLMQRVSIKLLGENKQLYKRIDDMEQKLNNDQPKV